MLLRSINLDKSLKRAGSQIRVGIPDEFAQRPARPCETSLPERKNGCHPTLGEWMAECPDKTIIERRGGWSPDALSTLLAGP